MPLSFFSVPGKADRFTQLRDLSLSPSEIFAPVPGWPPFWGLAREAIAFIEDYHLSKQQATNLLTWLASSSGPSPEPRSQGKHPHRRPRNRRVQMVQAKRKRLFLSPDGKCLDLGRRESYAYRLAEEAFYRRLDAGEDASSPRLADFRRHVPARRKRKIETERRRRRRQYGMESIDESVARVIASHFGVLPSELSTEDVDNSQTGPVLWWTSCDNLAAHKQSAQARAKAGDADE